MTSAPRRLLETRSLPSELTRALHAAPGEPEQADLQALANRLGATLGVPLAAPTLAAAPNASGVALVVASAAKPFSALAVWVLGGVALGVGLSGLATYSVARLDSPTPPSSPSAETRQVVQALSPAVAAAPPLAVEPEPTVAVASAGSAKPNPFAVERGATDAGLVTASTSADAAVALEPQESELSLLRRAQQVVSTNPSRALALSALHGRAFPGGLLAQEREVLAIDALTRLGRLQEAQARARAFGERYPGSAHAPRLRALLQR